MNSRRANGASIRALREALGIRHGDLAVAAGISAGYLTHIEQGARNPRVDVLRAIALRLGVPVDAISYATDRDATPVAS